MFEDIKVNDIKWLPYEEISVLKVIRVIGTDWIGYLPYLRDFKPSNHFPLRPEDYDEQKGDYLDKELLSAVCQFYPNSNFYYTDTILFEGQLQNRLKGLEGASRIQISIHLIPHVSFDVVGMVANSNFKLKEYIPVFNLRLNLHPESEKIKHINNYLSCSLDFDSLNDLVKTLGHNI